MRRLIIAAVFALGCGPATPIKTTTTTTTPAPSGPAIKLGWVSDLHEAYADNEAAADQTYLDKRVRFRVDGTVEKVGAGRFLLRGEVMSRLATQESPPYGVICNINPADNAKLATAKPYTLEPHIGLVLEGTCKGKKANRRAWNGFEVIVDDCRIVKVLTKEDPQP